jgi:Alginate lyase
MSAVSTGAQWASRRTITTMIVNTVAVVVAVASILTIARLSPTAAASDYILMSRAQLLSLPTSGSAWSALKARADSSIGTPDISNQDESADQTTLAKALVFARTGVASYRTAVVAALKRAVGTETGGRTLALGRNLAGYVLAADFIDLRSADPSFDGNTFRPWLRSVLTKNLDGKTLISTQERRPNNWGTHAGAARAAVAGYLGDSAQLARTAQVFRGWLGDRTAYAGFVYGELSWQCDPSRPVGINPPCTRSGVNIGGVIPDDMRRGGSLHWPPSSTGYPWEGLQGAVLEAELLRAQGYDAWSWSDKALLRAVRFLYERAHWPATGDDQWQPWLIDRRYGTSYHTAPPARGGKNFGFTDWLYGPSSSSGTTATTRVVTAASEPTSQPTARPTPAPTTTPAPTRSPSPTPAPTSAATDAPTVAPTPTDAPNEAGGQPTPSPTPDAAAAPTAEPAPEPTEAPTPAPRPRSQAGDPPEVSRPVVLLSATSVVPTAGVPVVVDWGLQSADAGLQSYQLEYRVGEADWVPIPLASPTSSVARHVVTSAHEVRYRVRAVDRNGEAGDWRSSAWTIPTALSDSSAALRYSGTWAFVNSTAYLDHRAHWTKARSAYATYTFDGAAVAWAGPVGPTRGKARIILDGRLVATVDSYRATYRARDIIWAATVQDGRHTLRIQALGTSGRPTVAVDGLYVLRER